jgi:hypothetical protein
MIILASALLAGSLLATGAQARGGGGGGHMGGFGGHMGGGIGGSHFGGGPRMASPDFGARGHVGYGLYDDGIGSTSYNYNLPQTYQTWPPYCS